MWMQSSNRIADWGLLIADWECEGNMSTTSTRNPQSAIRNPQSAIVVIVVVMTSLALSGCAGWQFGTRSLYRPDIRTVYVPPVDSASFRRNLGERLTEALVREIEQKSTFKVVSDPNADSVLECKILTDSKMVINETRFDDPRDIDLNFFVQVSWRDRRGDLINGQPTNVPLPPIVVNVGQSANFVPEGGQSLSTAQQEAFQKIAQQIAGMMEVGW
jgi:hypothetical protein